MHDNLRPPPAPDDDGPPVDPDEDELVAYLDGELDAAAVRRLEARLAAEPPLRAKAAALKRTYDLLDYLPQPAASATFSSRTLEKLPAVAAGTAAHTPAPPAPTPPPSPFAAATPGPNAPLTIPDALRPRRGPAPAARRWVLPVAVVGGALLVAAGGYLGSLAVRAVRGTQAAAAPADDLPARIRNEPDAALRDQLAAEWRRGRRAAWLGWDAGKDARAALVPWPFHVGDLRQQTVKFVEDVYRPAPPRLSPLTDDDLALLAEATEAATRRGNWVWYGRVVYDLSRRYEMLPAMAFLPPEQGLPNGIPSNRPVTRWEDIGDNPRSQIEVVLLGRAAGAKAAIDARLGKWPDFALALEAAISPACSGKGPTRQPIRPLGPCIPYEFSQGVKDVVLKQLPGKATEAEMASLRLLEGQWPAYPRRMIELARKYDLSVPGAMLPGPPSMWEKTYGTRVAARP